MTETQKTNLYLREQGRFFTAGFFDAKRGEKSQVDAANVGSIQDQYLKGYAAGKNDVS